MLDIEFCKGIEKKVFGNKIINMNFFIKESIIKTREKSIEENIAQKDYEIRITEVYNILNDIENSIKNKELENLGIQFWRHLNDEEIITLKNSDTFQINHQLFLKRVDDYLKLDYMQTSKLNYIFSDILILIEAIYYKQKVDFERISYKKKNPHFKKFLIYLLYMFIIVIASLVNDNFPLFVLGTIFLFEYMKMKKLKSDKRKNEEIINELFENYKKCNEESFSSYSLLSIINETKNNRNFYNQQLLKLLNH